MNVLDILACPACNSGEFRKNDAALICERCGGKYSILRDIIDFRDAKLDVSAGISITNDSILAKKMNEVFDRTPTFNELYDVYVAHYDRQKGGDDIRAVDMIEFIERREIAPRPLSPAQLAHGPAILAKIPEYLAESAPALEGIALEDGAGLGLYVDGFSSHFRHLIVVDLSIAQLMLARKIMDERGIQNVTLICANVERLPFKSDVFDFVHSNNVIEHVSDQKALLQEAWRILKPNGLLFLLSPNRFSLYFEPHFRLPGYGFFPEAVRRKIIRVRQKRSIDDISLLSLGELRKLVVEQFGEGVQISFIPRHLSNTVTGGGIRNLLVKLLNSKIFGAATDLLINRALLGVMPYHAVLCFKRGA
jgi:SAM-dependent methyltransferase